MTNKSEMVVNQSLNFGKKSLYKKGSEPIPKLDFIIKNLYQTLVAVVH